MMMDALGNKPVIADASIRKAPKTDAKAAAVSPPPVDASASQNEPSALIEVTIARGNGLSEQPFDYAKVISLKQSIKSGGYKIDFEKLADSMINTDILNAVRGK
jgi:flagellar biosynthesis anti-sigma factor FlgM